MSRIKGFESLKSKKEFDRIYRHADRVWHSSGFVVFFKKSNTPKVAFVAGKKVGNAVKRNRAKRLLRAHFILLSNQISKQSYIIVAKPQLLEQSFSQREKQFLTAFKKIGVYNHIS